MENLRDAAPAARPLPLEFPNLATVDASPAERRVARRVAIALFLIAILALVFRSTQLMALVGTVPAQSFLCLVAYGLTAFAILNQFRRGGHVVLAIVAFAYIVAGLLEVPHGLATPDAWVSGLLIGNLGTAAWSGSLAHLVFPAVVSSYVAADPNSNTIVQPANRSRWLVVTAAAAVCVAALITTATLRDGVLPRIAANGHFLPVLTRIGWCIVAANALAIAVIVRRTRCRTVLHLWLVIFLIGSGLDSLLFTVSPARYVVTWYANEAYAIGIAVLVLVVLQRQSAKLYRQVASLAAVDQLTGLPNRRSLENQLEWIVQYAQRNASTLAIVMVDIDAFKAFNDTYGHAAGDDALRRVAVALGSALRASDVIARYGGEEFLAILPDATLDGARQTVERMRAAIELLHIPHEGSAYGTLTGSFGAVAGYVDETADKRDLIRMADEAMYAAKKLGRNQSVVVPYPSPALPV